MFKKFAAGSTIVMIATLFTLICAPAFANDAERQSDQFEAMLAKQAELDSTNAAAQDRAAAEKWLKEARVLLANGDDSAADKRLRRVEFSIDLIRALVAAAEIRKAAEEQEASAYKGPEQLAELQAELETLKKRKVELERKLRSLK